MIRFAYLVFLFFSGGLNFIFSQENKTEYFIKEAEEKSRNKQYDQAIKIYSKAIGLDKTNPKLYTGRADAYRKTKEAQKAYNDYTSAITYDNKYLPAYLQRAKMMSSQDPGLAIKDNNMILMLAPKDDTIRFRALLINGSAKSRLRDFKGAYDDYLKAYQMDSNNAEMLNDMAMTIDELGEKEKAITFCLRAYKLDTAMAEALANIGFIKSKNGDYEGALEYLNKAIKRGSDQAYTYNNRGYVKLKLKDHTGALSDINKSLKMEPANSYAYRNRALVYFEQNKKEQACQDLFKARQMNFREQYGEEVDKLIEDECFRYKPK